MAGSMPLAFTQEDFLVRLISFVQPPIFKFGVWNWYEALSGFVILSDISFPLCANFIQQIPTNLENQNHHFIISLFNNLDYGGIKYRTQCRNMCLARCIGKPSGCQQECYRKSGCKYGNKRDEVKHYFVVTTRTFFSKRTKLYNPSSFLLQMSLVSEKCQIGTFWVNMFSMDSSVIAIINEEGVNKYYYLVFKKLNWIHFLKTNFDIFMIIFTITLSIYCCSKGGCNSSWNKKSICRVRFKMSTVLQWTSERNDLRWMLRIQRMLWQEIKSREFR